MEVEAAKLIKMDGKKHRGKIGGERARRRDGWWRLGAPRRGFSWGLGR